MNRKFIIAGLFVIFCFALLFYLINARHQTVDQQQYIKSELDKRIDSWEKYLIGSGSSTFTKNEYYKSIIDLGIPSLPYMIQCMEKGKWQLSSAVYQITKKHFNKSEWPDGQIGGAQQSAQLLVNWWKNERKLKPEKFQKRYDEWKEMIKTGKKDPNDPYKRITDFGLPALPYMIKMVKNGDTDLIESISYLTNGNLKKAASISETIDWWQKNKEDWLIPFPNKQPKADAGKDQIVVSGDVVIFDASNSNDPDKDNLEFNWIQTSGPSVKLDDPNSAKPKFMSPIVKEKKVLTFELMVNDGNPIKSVHLDCQSGQSEPDSVKVTIKPKK